MLKKLPVVGLKAIASIVVLFLLQLITEKVAGQSNPTAVTVPYTQNFSTFYGSSVAYPTGFQGWTVPGTLSTTVLTAAPSGNQFLYAGQDNSTTNPFIGDLVQKIGLLSGSSNVLSLCLAVNTSGVTGVQLIYTIETQGQTAGGFIDEMDLQYRIGTSGVFTTIAGATYQNTATTTTTTAGVTTGYNPSTIYVLLPAACNNQSNVQIRWIPRNVSGTGTTHPSFSITNITVQQNATTDYYSKATGNLDNIATWGINSDGSGAGPTDFVTNGQVFHISNGNTGILGGNWTVSGTNSVIVVDGTDFTNFISTTVTGIVNVNAGRTLTLKNPSLPTLGSLDPASTVVFTNLSGVTVPTVSPAYGNITFNNSTVALPAATQKLMFAGNFILEGSAGASFIGANGTLGYSLVTYGNNTQLINANGLPLTIWNLDIGSTNARSPLGGSVSLASNTTVNAHNSTIMILNGAAPQFIDSGNVITVVNNLDFSGNTAAYDFTGTIWMNGSGSGSQNIRGGTSAPNVAAVNNLILNNGIQVKLNGKFIVKGNLIITDTATGAFNFEGDSLDLGGNFIYLNTNPLLSMPLGSALVFDGTSPQSYSSALVGGNTFNMVNINNGTGLTLNSPMNISGFDDLLLLTNGVISTGINSINVDASGIVLGGSAASYVNGNLSLALPTGTGVSRTYQVGDITYAPITLTFPGAITASGYVTVKSTTGIDPNLNSFISTSNYVKHYWAVTNVASALVTSGNVNVALSYNLGDMAGGGPNTNYIVRQYAGSWTTSPSITNTTTASLPLLSYASTSAGVSGASFSGDYIAGAPDCTTSAGAATGTPAAICGSGSSILSLAGATTNTGNSYQWQSSTDGVTYSAITGASNPTYTPTISATTYYKATVGCIPTTATLNSAVAILTVNPLPSAILGATSNCVGSSLTLSDVTASGTWSSSNTAVGTIGSAGIYYGVVAGTTTISYTLPTGCAATQTVVINPVPPTPIVTPLLLSFCASSPAALVTATGDTVSGAVSATYTRATLVQNGVNVVDTSSVIVSGIPAGATITSVSVTFNIGGTSTAYQDDNIFNLRAPDGSIINLDNKKGGGSHTGGFSNVNISSVGTTALPIAGSGLMVSGVPYIASEAFNVGPTTPAGYKSNTTLWTNLYTTPNGNWTFISYNGFAEDTLKNWTINIGYTVFPSVTWSPVGGLYSNTSGTAYVSGTSTSSVYVLPTVTTTYNVTAAVGACTSTSSLLAIYSNPLYVPSIQGPSSICVGSNVTMTDSTSGGVWSSTGAATVSATGVVTGLSNGTATISFSLSSGSCNGVATKVVTVNPLPTVSPITGNTNLCIGTTTSSTLTDATTSGTFIWSSSNATVASVGSSSGIATALTVGSSIITYTFNNGTCPNSVTTTLSVLNGPTTVSVSPSLASLCPSSPAQMLVATGGYVPTSATVSSGTIAVVCNTVAPTATTLTLNAIPANAIITGIAVNINATSSYDGDAEINLVAPNGSTINLIGTTTGNAGVNFTNTTISSMGVNSIPNNSIGAPFTGVWAADSGVSLQKAFTTYAATTTSWLPLVASTPNGIWTLAGLDNYSTNTFTITSWSITIYYNSQVPITWSSAAGLYTNSSAGVSYIAGAATDTVYSLPTVSTVYTVSATNGFCVTSSTVPVNINSALYVPAVEGVASVCAGQSTTLTDSTVGGVWTSANTGVAAVGSTSGTVTGITGGTALISYTLSSGSCSGTSTVVVTINGLPVLSPITGVTNLCLSSSSTSILSNSSAGGTWSSGNISVATIGTSGSLTGLAVGSSVITYTYSNGTCINNITTTVNILNSPTGVSVSPTAYSMCAGGPVEMLTATSGILPVTASATTGVISVSVGAPSVTVTSPLTISGIPANATITGAYATLNFTSSYIEDYEFNLQAPNGQILDLIYLEGVHNAAHNDSFTNTIISSAGVTALSATGSVSPFTGIFAADSTTPSSIPSYSTTTTSWESLYTVPNGTWTLIAHNSYAAGTNAATFLTGYSITVNYTIPVTTTWSPVSGLYTNTSGTAYAGTLTDTVYAAPTVGIITYTASATNGFCSSTATATVTVNASPSTISGNLAVCVGGITNLSDAGGGTWSSSNTAVGSIGTSGSVLGVSPGTTTITYTLPTGCIATSVLTVNAAPSLTSASSNSPICAGSTLSLSANGATNVSGYLWTGPVSIANSTTANPSVAGATTSASGIYTVTISNGAGAGCVATYTTSATVNTLPISTGIINSGAICNGGTVTLTANSVGATVWSWLGSNGFTSSAQNPTNTPTVTTVYSLTVSSSGVGCAPSTVYTTTVSVNPVPSSTGVTVSAICNGGSTTLNANSTGATAWSWTGSNGFTSSLQNPTNTPTVTTTYSLTVSSTGSGCNSGTVYTATVSVNAVPSSTGATNGGAICNGGTATLNANSSNATAWSWTAVGGYTSSSQNPTPTPTVTTTYSLTVSAAGSGCNPSTIYTTTVSVNATPSSTGVTNSGPICIGGTATLNANSSNANAWSWMGSDGSTSSIHNPIVSPTVTTTYSLTLTGAGSSCNSSAIYTTVVSVNAVPSSTGATTNAICNGGTATLSANSVGATAWSWIGSNGFTSSLQNPTNTPTVTTTYSLTVSSAGNGCNPSAIYSTVVSVNPVPSSTGATNSGAICSGGTATLNANSSNATAWLWVGSNGFTSTIQNPTNTPTVTTTYSLSLSSAGSGCSPSTIYTTIVSVNPTPSSTGVTSSGPICNGGTAVLYANSNNATAWLWSGSNGFTSTLQNPSNTPTVTTTYSLTISGSSSGCNPNTVYTTVVSVNPLPSSAGITNNGAICNGGTVILNANSSNATAWSWTGSNGFTSSLQNPSNTPTVTTTYSLTVGSVGSGCNPSTVYTTIALVNPVPSSTGATNGGAICNGGTATLTANSNNTTAWLWIGSNGFTSTLQNPTNTPTVTTTYSLTLSSTGSGCSPATVYATTVTVNAMPSSTGATNSGVICNGGTVSLFSNSSNATMWSWAGSDASTSSLQNPSFTPTVVTTYSLTVSALGNGCASPTVYLTTVSVNPVPSSTGATNNGIICNGGTVALNANSSNATAWSWIGSNGFTSSMQNPTNTPTVTTTYSLTVSSLGSGCIPSTEYLTIVSVNAVPSSTGATNSGTICSGGTVTLNANSSNAAMWSWIGSNGFTSALQNPTNTPTVTTTYSLTLSSAGSGCNSSIIYITTVTVNPIPSSTGVTNSGAICNGGTVSLLANSSNATIWSWIGSDASTSSFQNPSFTPTITTTYSLTVSSAGGACNPSTVYTTSVTVYPVPTSTGATNGGSICNGGTVTLSSNSLNAGSWSWVGSDGSSFISQNPIASPTITTTYSLTVSNSGSGCSPSAIYTTTVSVNPVPFSTGATNDGAICDGFNASLFANSTNATAWSWVGSDGFTSTLQNPIEAPSVTTTYSLTVSATGSGCSPSTIYTTIVTVNPLPASILGSSVVTIGIPTTLTDASTGTWSSNNGNITIGSTTGTVSGITSGTSIITFTSTTDCITTTIMTVNTVPPGIGGVMVVCINGTTTLSDLEAGGTWSCSNGNATIGSISGILTGNIAGTDTITYLVPSTTPIYAVVTINPLPTPILGNTTICQGLTTSLSDAGGGTWSSSGNVSVGSTGIVTGNASGTGTITYALPTGCFDSIVIAINPNPSIITGTPEVCVGSTITLNATPAGGTWSSSNIDAIIGSSTGIATGSISGTSTITYTLASGCINTITVTIDPTPGSIAGIATVCVGSTTTLTSPLPVDGTWSCSNTNAVIGSSTGAVTGITAGTVIVTYTLSTGCFNTAIVTVNAVPDDITGTAVVCVGLVTTLNSTTTGGTWSSSNSNATIGSSNGFVMGSVAGTSVITYVLATGCMNMATITVNVVPTTITGAAEVCIGIVTTLNSMPAGGSWSASNGNVSIGSTGITTGVTAGTSVISYMLSTGCVTTTVVTVNPVVMPSVSLVPVSGDTVCSGTPILFTAIPINGGTTPVYQWKVNTTITSATGTTYNYVPSNGDVVSVILTSNAACTSPATAVATDTISVITTDTSSVSISVNSGDTVCLGSAVLFTAVGVNGGSIPAYVWYLNNIPQVSAGASYGLVPVNGDNIYCKLASSLRCKVSDTVSSNHIALYVDTSYIPTVTIYSSRGTTIHTGEADTFTAVVTGGGPIVTYQWFINSTIIGAATSDVLVSAGFVNNDSVTCVVTSSGPCGYASFNTVILNVVATGVQQLSGTGDVWLIPNPNKGQFLVKGSIGVIDEEISMEITDMLGQVVYKKNVMTHNGNISEQISLGNTLANGMYMLNLNSVSGHKVFHFVIEQ